MKRYIKSEDYIEIDKGAFYDESNKTLSIVLPPRIERRLYGDLFGGDIIMYLEEFSDFNGYRIQFDMYGDLSFSPVEKEEARILSHDVQECLEAFDE